MAIGYGGVRAIAALWQKQVPLQMNPDMYTGYYWGDDGYLGRHFFAVRVNEGTYGHWEVDIERPGWNRYRGFYPDGTLREEGEIDVTYGDAPPEPQPDQLLVKWGRYYRPDGSLSGEIRDGTGEQVIWYPDGKLRWRLVLRDYKRVMHELWAPDGKLVSKKGYDDEGREIEPTDR